MLEESSETLVTAYDLVMVDLDGVVYVGREAVPGAPGHLAAARAAGVHVAFVTNNASRTPAAVAGHLRELGVAADDSDVVTSAQAAAHLLAERLGPGARVLTLGAEGLEQALEAEGLVPTSDGASDPEAVVTGYGPDVTWRRLMEAAMAIRDGLWWVASNTDLTIPTPRGVGPGHGVQVRMLSEFSGVTPVVAGKPRRPLLDETVRRVGGRRPLMVGDRLDTDIAGAHEAGVDSLLVLTGVTGLAELVAAPASARPTYLAPGLEGLTRPHPAPTADPATGSATLDGWCARVESGELRVTGEGTPDDWWRVVAVAGWQHLDATGTACEVSGTSAPGSRGRG